MDSVYSLQLLSLLFFPPTCFEGRLKKRRVFSTACSFISHSRIKSPSLVFLLGSHLYMTTSRNEERGRLVLAMAADEIYHTQATWDSIHLSPSTLPLRITAVIRPLRHYLSSPICPGAKKREEPLHGVGKSWDTHVTHAWYKNNCYQHLYSTEDQRCLKTLQFFHQTMKLEPNLDCDTECLLGYLQSRRWYTHQYTGDNKHKTNSTAYFSCIYTLSFLLDVTAFKSCFWLYF